MLIAPFAGRSNNKRQETIAQFEELRLDSSQVLEQEGLKAKFVYILLNGEVQFYKKPHAFYQEAISQPVNVDIPLFNNPSNGESPTIGLMAGKMVAPCLLCEDAVFFKQPMLFSLKTQGTN